MPRVENETMRRNSIPSYQGRRWHRKTSALLGTTTKYRSLSVEIPSSPPSGNLPMPALTRQEFEALPPTIQRKHFSTLERLRLVHNTETHPKFERATVADDDCEEESPFARPVTEPRPIRKSYTGLRPNSQHPDALRSLQRKSRHQPRASSASCQSQTATQNRPTGCPLTEEEHLISRLRAQGVILDAADEAYLRMSKRQSYTSETQTKDLMDLDSFNESFRWLEDGSDLDLRLGLEDYHRNLRAEAAESNNTSHNQPDKRASFRRHLSVSRLSFSRSSQAPSRPSTRETAKSPSLRSTPSSAGHTKRKSRALTLISGNRQSTSEANALDGSAAHYQDPEARMKLRVYLASPQKFDEAIEFGFPSLDEVDEDDQSSHQFRPLQVHLDKDISLLDDDKASVCSDDSTATDLDSPKTPTLTEKTSVAQPFRVYHDPTLPQLADFAPATREMTLRMTLTRPDLRADEDQLYGWQRSSMSQKGHARSDSWAPSIQVREMSATDSIERQLAALDQESLEAQDDGMVRRLWKRVRRV